jgi:hypothetical protein
MTKTQRLLAASGARAIEYKPSTAEVNKLYAEQDRLTKARPSSTHRAHPHDRQANGGPYKINADHPTPEYLRITKKLSDIGKRLDALKRGERPRGFVAGKAVAESAQAPSGRIATGGEVNTGGRSRAHRGASPHRHPLNSPKGVTLCHAGPIRSSPRSCAKAPISRVAACWPRSPPARWSRTSATSPGAMDDSQGWRQERASLYKDPRNLKASVRRFYAEAAKHDRGQSVGELAADVQRPAQQFRGRYAQHLGEARQILKERRLEGTPGPRAPRSSRPARSRSPGRARPSTSPRRFRRCAPQIRRRGRR